jgi:hypothetical protein
MSTPTILEADMKKAIISSLAVAATGAALALPSAALADTSQLAWCPTSAGQTCVATFNVGRGSFTVDFEGISPSGAVKQFTGSGSCDFSSCSETWRGEAINGYTPYDVTVTGNDVQNLNGTEG